jgi:predicted nuclease with TOPRIM domain
MAADDITIENLRQLLHIQTELREQAETRWRKAQRILVGLLESFAPEEVDQRLKVGRPLDHLPVDELEQLVRQQVGNRLHQAQSLLKESQTAQRVQNLRDQLEKLITQVDELRQENKQLQDQINQLQAEKIDHLNQLAALHAVSSQEQQSSAINELENSLPDGGGPPELDWMATWRQAETFERDAGILKMIAETGLARRPLIEAQAA